MPKKTRKKKLAAEVNKQRQLMNPISHVVHKTTVTPVEKIEEKKNTEIISISPQDTQTLKNFKVDFKKSLTLIGFILCLELGLYLVSQQDYFNFIKF